MTTRRQHSPSGGGVLPKMAYAPGEAPPERVFFLGARYYAWKGRILLVEVYERVSKSVTSVCKKNQKSWKMYFMAVKKSRKQVLFSDFNIHIQKTRDGAFKGIKKLR